MEYCLYHPMKPATYHCVACKTTACDACVSHDQAKDKTVCHVCQQPAISLGSAHSAQPFWRRLDKSFRYPLNSQAITIIIGVAILSSVVSFLPFAFILILIVNGAFFKYGFTCLESSAWGNFAPVSVNEAFEGGLSLMLQLIAIVIGLIIMVIAAAHFFGTTAATLLGTTFLIGFPAIIINFALSKSVLDALNPVNMLRLITTIGLPYGLLLAFVFIMIGSVGVVTQLLVNVPNFVSVVLESMVSNYYTLVILHIMGYMIFQYQGKLGFTATEDYGEENKIPDEAALLKAEISVWVKEGNADKVLELYNQAVEKFPKDNDLFNKCYRFLVETRNIPRLKAFSSVYFDHLAQLNNVSRMSQVFKEIRALEPHYMPTEPHHRHLIAKACLEKDDFMTVIKLLNGLHKSAPAYIHLGDSYEILAEALECVPKYEAQAAQARKLATVLKQKQAAEQVLRSKEKKIAAPDKKRQLEPIKDVVDPVPAVSAEVKQEPGDLPPIDFPGFDGKY